MDLPLVDTTADPRRSHRFHAEPRGGFAVDIFPKAQQAAAVRLSRPAAGVELGFELVGSSIGEQVRGNVATAQVGSTSVKWTSYTDRLKEELTLSSRPAGDQIAFTLSQRGLHFESDEHGGYLAKDTKGLVHFRMRAPTVTDAAGNAGRATLTVTDQTAMIRLDPAFLTAAAYPVTVDPTSVYANAVLADTPVGYWRLGEATGTTAADSTGRGNNGTISGTVALGSPGLIANDPDTAFNFTDGGVLVPTSADLTFGASDSFSVEEWFTTTSGVAQAVFAQQQCSAGSIGLGKGASTAAFNFDDGPNWVRLDAGLVNDGKPHHLVGVRDTLAHKARLFLDGALGIEVTDTTTGPITPAQTQTWMGRRYPCPVPNQFTGTLDELAVYRKVLSADRIQEHYQLGRAPVAQDPDSQATFSIDLAGAFGWLTQDPVQTSTGNYAYRHTDVSIAGRGPSPTFERAYNSVATRVSALGKGWTFNYNAHLADAGDGTGALILVSPEGGSKRYTPAGNNTYTPPPGITTSLVLNQTNPATFTATLQDQTQWTFDNQGRLTAIKDRYGNVSTLTYDATSGRLTLVSDPASRGSLGFRYDTFTGGITSYTIAGGRTMACQTGRLCEVSDWSGRTIQYGYDASGRLTDVIDREQMSHPAAQRISTQYTYDGTTSHLTTITDANGHAAVTMTYDAQGRVASQKDALGLSTGQQTTFGPYGAAATCPAGATPPCTATTVTYPQSSFDAKAMTVVDTYDANDFLVRRVSTPSNVAGETYTESYTYATNGFRSSVTDPNGKTTTFCYDTGYNGQAISGSLGNLTRRIDPPVGANPPTVTLFKYDAKNNLIETVSPKGVTNGTTVTCSTDLSGAVNTSGLYITDMAYDATGAQLLSTTRKYIDPDLAGTQTATTKFEYGDAANPSRVTRTIPPRGNTGATPDYTYATTLAYFGSGSQAGMLQSATDPLGNQTTYTYDAVGRKLSMVDPNGNAAGGVPADHTWTFGYDNEDRLTSATAPPPASGGTALKTQTQYDAVGNRIVVVDANGQVTTYDYDVRDSLSKVHQTPNTWPLTNPNAPPSPTNPPNPATSPPGEIITAYAYDNLGNLSRVTRASGDASSERATDYVYDGLNRVRKETQYPSWPTTTPTLVTQTTYDGNNNRLTLVDPLNQTTTFGLDALNRLTTISYSDGVTPNVTYGYNPNSNRTTLTDGTGSTSYSYDELDRLLSVTSPGPKTVGYRYDLDGNRRKLIYPDSTAVTYSFDKASQLAWLADWAAPASPGCSPTPTARTTCYQYRADSHLKQVTNINGTTASYMYDNAQRLTQVLNQQGATTLDQHTYTLDAVGNRTQRSESLAQMGGGALTPTTAYGYDNLYRLTTTTPAAPAKFVVGDQVIEPTPDSNPAGTAQAFPYTAGASGSVSSLVLYLDASSTAANVAVGLYTDNGSNHPGTLLTAGLITAPINGAWNVASVQSANVTAGTKYWIAVMSPFGDNTAVFRDQTVGSGSETSSETTLTALPLVWTTGTSYSAGSLSAYGDAAADPSARYAYDPLGNRQSWNSTSYSYDRADRITAAGTTSYTVNANGNLISRGTDTFAYDQANRLKTATVGGTLSTYTYDGDGKRASMTVGATTTSYVYDISGGLPVLLTDTNRKYVWGAGGLAYETDLAGNVQAVSHADGLGSVRALTDAGGTLYQTYRTDAFGVATATQGPSTQPLQFTGEQVDPTGLVYLRARVYDPQSGRFFQRDRFPGVVRSPSSLDRYVYVGNNPLAFIDPTGLDPLSRATRDTQNCSNLIYRFLNPLCNPITVPSRPVRPVTTVQPVPIGPGVGVVFSDGPSTDEEEPSAFVIEDDPEGAFHAIVRTSAGQLVEVMSSVVREGSKVIWKNVGVYPVGGGSLSNQVGVRALLIGRQALAKALGYQSGTEVTITGFRVSGANPLRFIRPIKFTVD